MYQKFKNGKNWSKVLRIRSKKICSRILGSSFGGGASWSCACNWIYSAAVRDFPSIGDRASMIILVRNISSGVSSGGGNAMTGDRQELLNTKKVPLITIKLNNFIAFIALTLPISWTAFTTQDENLFFPLSIPKVKNFPNKNLAISRDITRSFLIRNRLQGMPKSNCQRSRWIVLPSENLGV